MPGVPFSRACEACKKRRVKCDERKPECTPCLRLGKGPCPGYHHTNKFIDEGPRLEKKRAATKNGSPPRGDVVKSPTKSAHLTSPRPIPTTPLSLLASMSEVPSSVPHPLPLLFFEDVARRGFDVLMLTPLTVTHCGRMKSSMNLLAGHSALLSTLQVAQVMPSFIWYLPSRLGISPILDAAVDLVFSAAGCLLTPASEAKHLDLMRKYGVALTYLRDAIQDPAESMSVETLAAVSLLGCWECLHSTSMVAWINHHRGMYMLIEKRGPSRHQTDFERQLLIASIGTIFTIALRDNHPCFLEQPEWQEIIFSKPSDSMIAREWTESYRCLPLICMIPRLLSTCRDIVRNSESQTSKNIDALVASASFLRQSFLDMAEKYSWEIGRYAPLLEARNAKDHWRVFCDAEDQKSENYANYLSGLAVIDRILFALRPSAVHLEEEARTSALEIQYLHSFIKTLDPKLQEIYLIHSERMALSVVLTSKLWSSPRSDDNGGAFDPKLDGGGNIIEQWKFDKFDGILCARAIDAPLMYHYPASERQSSF